MNNTTYLDNYFLIAMPSLADAGFRQSVVYICEHNEHGAIGTVINKPISMMLGEIFQQMDISCHNPAVKQLPVLGGGPIEQERGFVFHRPGEINWRSSIHLSDDIAITTSKDVLEAVATGNGPASFVLTLGYAGWGPGQLEQEIKENSWLTMPANIDILYHSPFEQRWDKAIKSLGIDPLYLASESGHA
jgi:putative transcriptional regulator